MSAPILALPNNKQPFRVKADSLDFTSGGVLLQLSKEDEKWHPIAFLSKSLTSVQRNYEVHDKELLAIIRCLQQWRHFLEGAWHPVKIWMDHQNLKYFGMAQDLNHWQACWSLFLSWFNYTLCHCPGSSMGEPNALSCCADHRSHDMDNQGVVLLSPSAFQIHMMHAMLIRGPEKTILQDIQECLATHKATEEPVAAAACQLPRDKTHGQLWTPEWGEVDGLLTFHGCIYVPDSCDLRQCIIMQYHNSQVAGHLGHMKTLELISHDYWWPQISRHVRQYT